MCFDESECGAGHGSKVSSYASGDTGMLGVSIASKERGKVLILVGRAEISLMECTVLQLFFE